MLSDGAEKVQKRAKNIPWRRGDGRSQVFNYEQTDKELLSLCLANESRSWSMEFQEGKNSKPVRCFFGQIRYTSGTSTMSKLCEKPLLWNRFRSNLGEMGFYRETVDFLVFAYSYWSSHWNGSKIRMKKDCKLFAAVKGWVNPTQRFRSDALIWEKCNSF